MHRVQCAAGNNMLHKLESMYLHSTIKLDLQCRHFQQADFSNFDVLEKQAETASVTIGAQTGLHICTDVHTPITLKRKLKSK